MAKAKPIFVKREKTKPIFLTSSQTSNGRPRAAEQHESPLQVCSPTSSGPLHSASPMSSAAAREPASKLQPGTLL